MTRGGQPSLLNASDASAARRSPLATHLPEFLILIIALLTRCWQHNYHSLWFDEAASLRWAGADLGYIWRKTFPLIEEKHPPVYYIGLHF